jgi:hypothetical protein
MTHLNRRGLGFFLFLFAWLAGLPAVAGPLIFCCSEDNDLFRVATENRIELRRVATPAEAIAMADEGAGVLLLANGYPAKLTELDAALFEQAAKKKLRLYVEYPSCLPGTVIGAPKNIDWERAAIASDAFAPALARLRILSIPGCRFVPIQATNPQIVIGRIAGFDTAVYGLAKTSYPILCELPQRDGGSLLVATTKLSHFVTGRYAPQDAWQIIWKQIFAWLQPDRKGATLTWTASVRPSFRADEPLPADIEKQALRRGIDWYFNSRMVVHPAMLAKMEKPANGPYPAPAEPDLRQDWPYGHRIAPMPDLKTPPGDGSLGVLEGFDARILADGTQPVRWWRRNDCNGEIAGAMALAGTALQNPAWQTSAGNLGDWLYFHSRMALGDRVNPKHPADGLIGWNDSPQYCGPGSMDGYAVYYGDDNARSMLGMMLAAAALKTDRYDERLLKCLLANLRLSGRFGFQPDRIDQGPLENAGWQAYFSRGTTSYSPHYQATLWACYLWGYRQTGNELFLRQAKKGIGMTMAAYPDRWIWTNGMQQERAKMLLALAWLVRVEDTPEHRAWLRLIAKDLLAAQAPCGAIREEIGKPGQSGGCPPPASNDAYGTSEAPLIQTNGDPACDLLYTCNFAFAALHEAAAATGEPFYRQAEDQLAQFLCRIQIRSETHPELDGGWFRAFDFRRWEYWASNTDAGWGAWCIESGWTQSWITIVLALRQQRTSLWEITAASQIKRHLDPLKRTMLPEAVLAATATRIAHAGIGKSATLAIKPSDNYPGNGAASLTDGELGSTDCHDAAWLGFQGSDLVATIDLGAPVELSELGVSLLQDASMGIFLPRQVEFRAGDDPGKLQLLGTVQPATTAQQPGPRKEIVAIKNLHLRARHIEIRATSLGKIPAWHRAAGVPAWLFADELIVNPEKKQPAPLP